MELTYDLLNVMRKSARGYNDSIGTLHEQDEIYCEDCNNRGGFIEIQMVDLGDKKVPYEVYVNCKCQLSRENLRGSEKLTTESGLKDLLTKNFDNYHANTEEQKRIKSSAFENVDQENWFFIGGQSGAGKSHICGAIAKSLLNQRKEVKYSIWINDFKELNFLQGERKEFNYKIGRLKDVDILLIDDFFKTKKGEDITNADVQIAYEVINYRYNENKKTIISSELTINEIMKHDEALAGRIVEMAKPYIINIAKDINKNYRLK